MLFLPFGEFIFSLINAGKNPDIKKKNRNKERWKIEKCNKKPEVWRQREGERGESGSETQDAVILPLSLTLVK